MCDQLPNDILDELTDIRDNISAVMYDAANGAYDDVSQRTLNKCVDRIRAIEKILEQHVRDGEL